MYEERRPEHLPALCVLERRGSTGQAITVRLALPCLLRVCVACVCQYGAAGNRADARSGLGVVLVGVAYVPVGCTTAFSTLLARPPASVRACQAGK